MDHMLRPKSTVLPESAMVPERNLISPAPNQFTHQVTSDQPYFYEGASSNKVPDGVFKLGTKVVLLMHDGGAYCHVADAQGLYVVTLFNALETIDQ